MGVHEQGRLIKDIHGLVREGRETAMKENLEALQACTAQHERTLHILEHLQGSMERLHARMAALEQAAGATQPQAVDTQGSGSSSAATRWPDPGPEPLPGADTPPPAGDAAAGQRHWVPAWSDPNGRSGWGTWRPRDT